MSRTGLRPAPITVLAFALFTATSFHSFTLAQLCGPDDLPRCGDVLSSNTNLTCDLDCSTAAGPALTIGSSGITFDGGNHTITTGSAAGVLVANVNNIILHDFTVQSAAPGSTTPAGVQVVNSSQISVINANISGAFWGLSASASQDIAVQGGSGTFTNNYGGLYFTFSDRISIDNVTADSNEYGLVAEDSNILAIANSRFTNNTADGIFIPRATNSSGMPLSLSNLVLTGNGGRGLGYANALPDGPAPTLDNVDLSNSASGASFENMSGLLIDNCSPSLGVIFPNDIANGHTALFLAFANNTTLQCIHLYGAPGSTSNRGVYVLNSNLVTVGGLTTQDFYRGFEAWAAIDVRLTNPTATFTTAIPFSVGLSFVNNSSMIFVNGAVISGALWGLSASSSNDITVQGGTFTNNLLGGAGLYFTSSNGIRIENNVMSNNNSNGLVTEGSQVLWIRDSRFANNMSEGVSIRSATNTTPVDLRNLDLTGNLGFGLQYGNALPDGPAPTLENVDVSNSASGAWFEYTTGLTIDNCPATLDMNFYPSQFADGHIRRCC